MNRLSIFTILLSGTGLLIHLEKDQNVNDSTDPIRKKNGITHFQSPDINHPVCGQVVNTLSSGCEGPGFQGSSLTCCVVSLDRELYSTFSLFT